MSVLDKLLAEKDGDCVNVIVGHGYYGCESGCCGTEIHLVDANLSPIAWAGFEFSHDYDARLEEAKEISEKLGLPLRDDAETRRRVSDCW